METINGQWYMKGCDPADPRCLHSAGDLADLVEQMGFLPLFANEIPGFSVEERTTPEAWWSSDPARDPWEWRIELAGRKDIAYGKFFDRKAGYVSAGWFPALANYRRSGYDFDALYDDGLASHRARKLMLTLAPDEEGRGLALFSNELKQAAGFGKGGEKNFEGVLTELQMRTYLILGDFRQRLNRAGLPYGWHLAVVQTPETKWGYEAVTACYGETREESFGRITEQLRRWFPEAGKDALGRLLGMASPGAARRGV